MIKVAVGIITLGSQILVCQRKKTSRYPLKWEFPGGKFEEGESAEQCLRRELREELSIEANVGTEFFRQQWDYPDSGSFEVYYHHIPSFSGTMRNNVFEQVRWIHSAGLNTVDMLDGNKEVVEKIRSQNGTFPNGTASR
ncbi:MAG TPA: (deoxy)nucleoside triphosphate pyrophosphohydrolase [Bacteroidota bacterium]|nr:(deoxy)nucleoside triphosphate pyrophosphohydrolase [Bacteroidota bacterium]